jgi:hypothetical protein
MCRRLLECLQQGIEGLLGEHVDLIDDDDLVLAGDRSVSDFLSKIPNVIYAAVGGTIDFSDIKISILGNLCARWTLVARGRRGPLFAVQGLCQDARHGGLAHASRAGEQVSVADAIGADGVLKGPGDVLLAGDLFKGPGPPFKSHDLVGHWISRKELKIEDLRLRILDLKDKGPDESNCAGGVGLGQSKI